MFEIKVQTDIKDLEKLTAAYPEAAMAARTAKLTEALQLIDRVIKLKTPVGAGPIHIRDTMFGQVTQMGESTQGIYGTPAAYGEPLECGARPHFPPVAPIQHWVEGKLGLSGQQAKSVAFLIARAISRRGTPAAHMFDKGFAENEAAVMAILEQIPDDIVRRVG